MTKVREYSLTTKKLFEGEECDSTTDTKEGGQTWRKQLQVDSIASTDLPHGATGTPAEWERQ